MPELALGGVSKSYRGFTLGPVTADLSTGVTALLGANGAGKSTLLRLLVRVESPTRGSVRLTSGRSTGSAGVIGYLPQDFVGPKNVTARDYLRFIAWCRSSRLLKLTDRHVAEALERVGLEGKADTRIGALSGGMVRRLGIAQAIMGGADLLVLDEPTVGLDPLQRAELRSLVSELASETIVLMSTHLCEDVAASASRVHVLADGRSRFDGPIAELVALGLGAEVSTESVERGFLAVLEGREAQHVA